MNPEHIININTYASQLKSRNKNIGGIFQYLQGYFSKLEY